MPPTPADPLAVTVCPGEGRFTRGTDYVTGSGGVDTIPKGIKEWTWAQQAMFGYFYPNFKLRYLLLYEIHSVPVKSAPDAVLKRMAQEEDRRRRASQTAYGVTLTPWVTDSYFRNDTASRDALLVAAGVAGVALLVLAAVYLAPVVAGIAIDSMAGLSAGIEAAADAEISTNTLATLGSGLTTTMETAGQWMSALGRPVIFDPSATFAP
jgi:hypothetical protein